MTIRKHKNPTPHFRLPPPYSPVTGQEAPLSSRGVYPYVAMMQVAKTDVHQNYVVCRGHDVRFSKFYDYAAGDPDKPGIPVAKPYGRRRPCLYRVGQIFPAIIPLQTPNPQPASVPWRVGTNPGVATVSVGHPADLYETVTELYTDEGKLIDYMFLEGETQQDMIVRAVGCILPGEGGSVRAQQWNSITQCWEDDAYDPFTIIDPMGWLLAVTGDCFAIKAHHGGCGESLGGDYMPAFPFGMTQLVRVLEKIDCGKCGEVVIVRKAAVVESGGHCDMEETVCAFVACNMSYRPLSCDAQEYAIAHIIPGQCCLPDAVEGSDGPEERCIAFLMPYPRPIFAKATLDADLCEGDAALGTSSILDACADSDFTVPTAAGNTAKLHACTGTDVLLLWKVNSDEYGQSCAWEVIAVEDSELPDWMVDIQCGDDPCTINKKVKEQKRYGHFCKCSDDGDILSATSLTQSTIDVIVSGALADAEGDPVDVFREVSCQSCELQFLSARTNPKKIVFKTKQVCVLCPPSTNPDGTDIEVDGLWDIKQDDGATKSLFGTEIDVVTDLKVQSEVTSEGGGDEVDCATGIEGTLNLLITGKTKTICAFCSTGEGGSFAAGADVPLTALKLSSVEVLTDAEFTCDPCIGLTPSTKVIWAFCVDASETVWDAVTCNCYDCPPEESA